LYCERLLKSGETKNRKRVETRLLKNHFSFD